jgi:hypothetical protein
LLGPNKLKPVGEGRLLFYVENQGVYFAHQARPNCSSPATFRRTSVHWFLH